MDSNNPDSQDIGSKAVADIKKDFVAMGAHRVHGWYAWAIVGIVVGMAWGIVYVSSWSNQKVTFDASKAATVGMPANGGRNLDIANIIQQKREDNTLLSANLESVQLKVRENKGRSLIFPSNQEISLSTDADWFNFQNRIIEIMNGSEPIELSLNLLNGSKERYLLTGKNLSIFWQNVFFASSGGGRQPPYNPPPPKQRYCRCITDLIMSFTCKNKDGSEYTYESGGTSMNGGVESEKPLDPTCTSDAICDDGNGKGICVDLLAEQLSRQKKAFPDCTVKPTRANVVEGICQK